MRTLQGLEKSKRHTFTVPPYILTRPPEMHAKGTHIYTCPHAQETEPQKERRQGDSVQGKRNLYIHVNQNGFPHTLDLGYNAFEIKRLREYDLEDLLHVDGS